MKILKVGKDKVQIELNKEEVRAIQLGGIPHKLIDNLYEELNRPLVRQKITNEKRMSK